MQNRDSTNQCSHANPAVLIIGNQAGILARRDIHVFTSLSENTEDVYFVIFERSSDFASTLSFVSNFKRTISRALLILPTLATDSGGSVEIPTSHYVFTTLLVEWLESNKVPYSCLSCKSEVSLLRYISQLYESLYIN
jgi:hypothetical protein